MQETFWVGGTLSLTQSIYCIFSESTMSSQRKFTFAISSLDEFLVLKGKIGVTPSVAAPGDTNPSDATAAN